MQHRKERRRTPILFFCGKGSRAPLRLDPALEVRSFDVPAQAIAFARTAHPPVTVVDAVTAPQFGLPFLRRLRDCGYDRPAFAIGSGSWHPAELEPLSTAYLDGSAASTQELTNRIMTAIEAHDALAGLRDSVRPANRANSGGLRRIAGWLAVAAILVAAGSLAFIPGCNPRSSGATLPAARVAAHHRPHRAATTPADSTGTSRGAPVSPPVGSSAPPALEKGDEAPVVGNAAPDESAPSGTPLAPPAEGTPKQSGSDGVPASGRDAGAARGSSASPRASAVPSGLEDLAIASAMGDGDAASLSVSDGAGDILYDRSGNVGRTPASTIKLLVAAVGLTVLGPDFRFTTSIGATHPPHDGSVDGDLYVRGDGDPTLGSADLAAAAARLHDMGIRRVTGSVVVSVAPFGGSEQNSHWPALDLPEAYAAGSSAVSLDGNVQNGTAIHHIPQFVAEQFAASLRAHGIAVAGSAGATSDVPPFDVLWQRRSAPLRSIVGAMLSDSINLDAEQILRRIGLERFGRATPEAGIRAEMEQLARWNVDTSGLRLYDGSGLAPGNRITTRQFAGLLNAVERSPIAADFLAEVPVAGAQGTVARRELTAGTGRVRAKDGHLTGVDALAGYVDSATHGRLAFAYLSNDPRTDPRQIERAQDRVADVLARY